MDLHLQMLRRIAQSDGTATAWAAYANALERAQGGTREDDGTYGLALAPEQMKTIIDATDMYSRVLCGQLGIVAEPFMFRQSNWHEGNNPGEAQEVLESQVKPLLFPTMARNESLSIGGPDTPESAKMAYDVLQVLRHRLTWDQNQNREDNGEENPFAGGVWAYAPSKTSQQSLPRLLSNTSCPCKKHDCPNSEKTSEG